MMDFNQQTLTMNLIALSLALGVGVIVSIFLSTRPSRESEKVDELEIISKALSDDEKAIIEKLGEQELTVTLTYAHINRTYQHETNHRSTEESDHHKSFEEWMHTSAKMFDEHHGTMYEKAEETEESSNSGQGCHYGKPPF